MGVFPPLIGSPAAPQLIQSFGVVLNTRFSFTHTGAVRLLTTIVSTNRILYLPLNMLKSNASYLLIIRFLSLLCTISDYISDNTWY